jgi:hypothetical protein
LVGRKYTFLVTIVMIGISTKQRAETHSPNDCTAAISGSYERALGR